MPSIVIKVIIIDIWVNGRVSKKAHNSISFKRKEDGQQIGYKKENSKKTTADHWWFLLLNLRISPFKLFAFEFFYITEKFMTDTSSYFSVVLNSCILHENIFIVLIFNCH